MSVSIFWKRWNSDRLARELLCVSIVLALLLTACSAPDQIPESVNGSSQHDTYGIYEFDFSVEPLSGESVEDWDFVFSYQGEPFADGHRIVYSLERFTFYYIQVQVSEKASPGNSFCGRLPVAICDGGAGELELTVTGSDGRTAAFRIVCNVTLVGKQRDTGPH